MNFKKKRRRFEITNELKELGQNELHFYAYCGTLAGINVFATVGVDVNKQDRYGMTPLHYAALNGKQEAAQCLLQHGADPRIKNSWGQSVSDIAEWKGHVTLQHYLQSAIAHYQP
jgi:cytohesin